MQTNPDIREIKDLLHRARTVAVVGLSNRPYRTSHAIAGALQRFGFEIFPVNPNLHGPVLGEEPYHSVEDIPGLVDIVDVFRRSEKVMPVAEAAAYLLAVLPAIGYLHDLGKVRVPHEILNKPGKLTPEEFAHIKDHVRIGMEILEPLRHIPVAITRTTTPWGGAVGSATSRTSG